MIIELKIARNYLRIFKKTQKSAFQAQDSLPSSFSLFFSLWNVHFSLFSLVLAENNGLGNNKKTQPKSSKSSIYLSSNKCNVLTHYSYHFKPLPHVLLVSHFKVSILDFLSLFWPARKTRKTCAKLSF